MSVLALKGALSEEKARKVDLTLRIDANVKATREILNYSLLVDKAEMDIRGASIHINEALKLQDELKEVLDKIRTLEKEING